MGTNSCAPGLVGLNVFGGCQFRCYSIKHWSTRLWYHADTATGIFAFSVRIRLELTQSSWIVHLTKLAKNDRLAQMPHPFTDKTTHESEYNAGKEVICPPRRFSLHVASGARMGKTLRVYHMLIIITRLHIGKVHSKCVFLGFHNITHFTED